MTYVAAFDINNFLGIHGQTLTTTNSDTLAEGAISRACAKPVNSKVPGGTVS